MGAWGEGPWDNDNAADWKLETEGVFDLRHRWLHTMHGSMVWDGERIRAAVALFQEAADDGRWPAEHFTEDLELASTRLKELADLWWHGVPPYWREALEEELRGLVRLGAGGIQVPQGQEGLKHDGE